MSFFNSILSALGIGSAEAAEAPVAAEASATTATATAITVVDVVAKLEGLAASHAEKLINSCTNIRSAYYFP